MSSIVNYRQEQALAVISMARNPVNALGQKLRAGIADGLKKAWDCDAIQGIILCSECRVFCAGGDINEFDNPDLPPSLPELLKMLEESPVPIVAALHGQTLGGGLELAMAAHYRIAEANTRLGMPEINLGLIPGAGGTVYAPRLIGIEASVDMILSGKPVTAEKALTLGLIDQLSDSQEELLEDSRNYLRDLLARSKGTRPTPTIKRAVDISGLSENYFAQLKQLRRKNNPHFPAYLRAIEALEAAVKLPADSARKKARKYFLELIKSPESQALRHSFAAQRSTGKAVNPYLGQARKLQRVGVIGGGAMGVGIGVCLANSGLDVELLETDEKTALKAEKNLAESIARMTRGNELLARETGARVNVGFDFSVLENVDLVIEAVFEDLEVKQQVFAKLDSCCSPDCILATNTSYLDINQIGHGIKNPERLIGMHFFNPPQRMKLIEIIAAEKSSEATIASVWKLALKLKKIPVLAGMCYGFIGNRMLIAYMREAQQLLLEGADPEQVDKAMTDWGMAMGPIAVADLAGLDIGYKARRQRPDLLRRRPHWFSLADALVESGQLGRKTGRGFYSYSEDLRSRKINPEYQKITDSLRTKFGFSKRQITAEEIVWRLTGQLINSAADIIAEGIAQNASDIDTVWINGYAFPSFRGGPLYFAHQLGINFWVKKCREFLQLSGENYWQPAPLLTELAESGKSFYSG